MSIRRLVCLLVVPCLLSCDTEFTAPPVSLQVRMEMGPGMSALLPHQQEGTRFPLTVFVTKGDQPASGVEVSWDDGRSQSNLSSKRTYSDADGIARTVWNLPAIPANVPWTSYSTQVSIPGASGSPIVYTIEVYRCTRC
ncbi:MAG TPA: hypothetical protein VFV65_05205 [Gemmatimonadales bacterium]|nr:hypothetical protein [Gemmatimonadales bacterium]